MIPVQVIITKPRRFRKPKRREFHFELPESWEEMNEAIRPMVVRELAAGNEYMAKMIILRNAIPIQDNEIAAADPLELGLAYNTLDWVKIKSDAKPLAESFEHNGRTYFFPKEKFENGTALEFAKADEFFQAYVSDDGKKSDLINLTALLCREGKKDKRQRIKTGDPRIPIEELGEIELWAKDFEDLPIEYMTMVLLYFSGVKNYVHTTYGKFLFAQPPSDEDEDSAPAESGVMFGWWGVFMNVASDGIFGKYDDVLATNFHDLCAYLIKQAKERQDAERKQIFNQSNEEHGVFQ